MLLTWETETAQVDEDAPTVKRVNGVRNDRTWFGRNLALFTLFSAYALRPLSIRDPYRCMPLPGLIAQDKNTRSRGMNIENWSNRNLSSRMLPRFGACIHG